MTDVRGELERIREQRGQLTAAAVVAAATPDGHPLHNRFVWDDKVAGHAFRLHQARSLIRSVRIEVPTAPDSPEVMRAYVSVPRPAGRRYEPVEQVAEDPVTAEIVAREYQRAWHEMRRRYGHLREFFAFVAADLPVDNSKAS